MSYDLALSRSTHDMVWQLTNPHDPIPKFAFWAIEGQDRVAQQVKMTLLAFLGEWFLDTNFGIPYLEEILVKNPRLSSVEAILRSRIKAVPDLVRLTFFGMEFDRMRRTLRVDFNADTNLGPIKDSIVLNMAMRTP